MTSASAVSIQGVSFNFPGRTLLTGLRFEVRPGETICLAGPNGAGKTTLLKLIAGTLRPSAGRIVLNGHDIRAASGASRARLLAMVPQDTSLPFPYSVWEFVAMGRTAFLPRWGFERQEDLEAIRSAILATDLEGFEHRLCTELSGGERQRVLLAQALAQQADILLLDEPATGLDVSHARAFFEVLKNLQAANNRTILMTSHDLNQASALADRFILLRNGQIVADGKADVVLRPDVLEEVFGTRFEEATTAGGRRVVVPV